MVSEVAGVTVAEDSARSSHVKKIGPLCSVVLLYLHYLAAVRKHRHSIFEVQ